MPGLAIPYDRTTKQCPRGYCFNPECREQSEDSRFEFDAQHDRFCCPKCSSTDPLTVGLLVLTHLLVLDRTGPIRGGQGLRYRLACDAKRAYLATETNLEAATGMPEVANCPGCLKALRDDDAKHFKKESGQ